MSKRELQFVPSPSAPFRFAELMVAITYFVVGVWTLQMGWDNPRHLGWILSGAFTLLGMIVCVWLIWHRRKTQRSMLVHILLVVQIANVIEGAINWQKEESVLLVTHIVLALVFLTLIIWEESSCRKRARKDATREANFEEEDRP